MNDNHAGPEKCSFGAIALLVALVIGSMVLLSWYINSHGPNGGR